MPPPISITGSTIYVFVELIVTWVPVPNKNRSPLITVVPSTVKDPPKYPPPATTKALVAVVPVELPASPITKFLPMPTPPTTVNAAVSVELAAVSSNILAVFADKLLSTVAPP